MTEVKFNMELHRIKQHPILEQGEFVREAIKTNPKLQTTQTYLNFLFQHVNVLLSLYQKPPEKPVKFDRSIEYPGMATYPPE